MFLAYVGHGYQGMQRNPGAKTIEDELFRALHAAGGISDANADDNGFIKVGACRRRRCRRRRRHRRRHRRCWCCCVSRFCLVLNGNFGGLFGGVVQGWGGKCR